MSSANNRPGHFRSLSLRLTGWYLLVFSISTALLSAAVGLEVRSSVHESNVQSASTALATHQRALEAGGPAGLRQLVEAPRLFEERIFVRVVAANGATLFEYRSTSAMGLQGSNLSPAPGAPPFQSIQDKDGARWDLATAPLADGRFLQLALRDERSDTVLGHLRIGLALGWLVAILVGLAGGFLLTRISLKPVQQLTATAREVISSGNLQLRVPESGVDGDLRELSHLFNGVLARNQALVQGMREALDNVAHDLRTPLTRLRTGAEVALREDGNPGAVREALGAAVEQSEEVLGLLTSLMDITEAETGMMRLTLTALNLSTLVIESVELYEHVADERGIRVVTHLLPEVPLRGDLRRLRQVVANLLDNAVKYTAVGGLIELTTRQEGGFAVLVVNDNGMGIAPADLPRIWTRLFRGDASRSQRGLGLGLSLVKAIVETHGGSVSVQSDGRGSTFTVRLPLAGPQTTSFSAAAGLA